MKLWPSEKRDGTLMTMAEALRQEGIQQGLQKGKQEGYQEATRQLAQRLVVNRVEYSVVKILPG